MNKKNKIIIGTRGSDLALWQANFVQQKLLELSCDAEIKIIKTRGDQIQHLSFEKMEGKGFFTKEIEDALLSKEIDLAIHSYKDLETADVTGLHIAAVSYRETPTDCLLIDKNFVDESKYLSLSENATIGTSSARRKSQLKGFRNDLIIKDLRGNVPTRIESLRKGNYNAIMLASAGLKRLEIDLSDFYVKHLDPKEFIPAPAQGVLGLQTRIEDKQTNSIVSLLNRDDVKETIAIERQVLKLYSGGCQLPLGVYCEKNNGNFEIWAALGHNDNTVTRAHLVEKSASSIPQKVIDLLKKKA